MPDDPTPADLAIAWEMSARLRGAPACNLCKKFLDNPHDRRTAMVSISWCYGCWSDVMDSIARYKSDEAAWPRPTKRVVRSR